MIFAAENNLIESLLWTIELISGVYGLHLNRSKCVALNLNDDVTMQFLNGMELPINDKAEYLGVMMNSKVDPEIEVNRRIAGARYTWIKLKHFWRKKENFPYANGS